MVVELESTNQVVLQRCDTVTAGHLSVHCWKTLGAVMPHICKIFVARAGHAPDTHTVLPVRVMLRTRRVGVTVQYGIILERVGTASVQASRQPEQAGADLDVTGCAGAAISFYRWTGMFMFRWTQEQEDAGTRSRREKTKDQLAFSRWRDPERWCGSCYWKW